MKTNIDGLDLIDFMSTKDSLFVRLRNYQNGEVKIPLKIFNLD